MAGFTICRILEPKKIKCVTVTNVSPSICHEVIRPKEYVKAVYCHPAYLTYMQSSVQSLSCVWLFVTPWIAARQASLSITNSRTLLKLMPIESVMPSSHLILCRPLLLLLPIPPSIKVFSNESTLYMRWPKCWSFSFSISPSNEHPGLEYIMRNPGLEEAQAGIKIARRNINNPRYSDDTTLMAESEEELKKPLDESEGGEWKSWLKAQHSEN